MNNANLMIEAQRAMNFLMSHPAVNHEQDTFAMFSLCFWINQVCKNGVIKDDREEIKDVDVRITKDDPKYLQFKDKYFEEDDDESDPFFHLNVPYKEYYGYDWEFERCFYGAEYSLYKYVAEDNKILGEWKDWAAYEGGYVKADTFEEVVIKVAEEVKRDYGDFSYESFYTPEEKNRLYSTNWFDISFNEAGERVLKHNDVPHATDGMINKRWWAWYRTTAHYKECWAQE